jgi:hypothetical protein
MQHGVASCRNGDAGTLFREQPGDRVADALRGAVDDRYLAGEFPIAKRGSSLAWVDRVLPSNHRRSVQQRLVRSIAHPPPRSARRRGTGTPVLPRRADRS